MNEIILAASVIGIIVIATIIFRRHRHNVAQQAWLDANRYHRDYYAPRPPRPPVPPARFGRALSEPVKREPEQRRTDAGSDPTLMALAAGVLLASASNNSADASPIAATVAEPDRFEPGGSVGFMGGGSSSSYESSSSSSSSSSSDSSSYSSGGDSGGGGGGGGGSD